MSATNQYQPVWQIKFHLVRSSALWRGVKTRPETARFIWLISIETVLGFGLARFTKRRYLTREARKTGEEAEKGQGDNSQHCLL